MNTQNHCSMNATKPLKPPPTSDTIVFEKHVQGCRNWWPQTTPHNTILVYAPGHKRRMAIDSIFQGMPKGTLVSLFASLLWVCPPHADWETFCQGHNQFLRHLNHNVIHCSSARCSLNPRCSCCHGGCRQHVFHTQQNTGFCRFWGGQMSTPTT